MDRTYPHGVPCWVDTEQPDLDAAQHFYGSLFGWSFANAMPPGAPGAYLIATLDGQGVAAIGPGDSAAWNTYVSVDDADASAAAVTEVGGIVLMGPQDAGPGGRMALCADPEGAGFRLWQARRRPGAQLVNSPGSWNFSDVHAHDLARETDFYVAVFGWAPSGSPGDAVRVMSVPGYGDHLEATVDPDIRTRQAGAPAGFADVVGSLVRARAGEKPHWHVRFAVADRDATAATAHRLGATVLESADHAWNRDAIVRDPQGATFSISEFTPPS